MHVPAQPQARHLAFLRYTLALLLTVLMHGDGRAAPPVGAEPLAHSDELDAALHTAWRVVELFSEHGWTVLFWLLAGLALALPTRRR